MRFKHLKLRTGNKLIPLLCNHKSLFRSDNNSGKFTVTSVAALIKNARILLRSVEEESCAVFTVAYLFGFLQNPFIGDIIRRRILFISVNRATVCVCYHCGIICGFCTPFYFQACYSRINKFGNIRKHTHILCVHDICSVLIIIYGEILTRSCFLNQIISPPARLSTVSPV